MVLIDLNVHDEDDCCGPSSHSISQAPCIYLSAAQAKALGITEPPRAGTKLMLQGQCIVESVTELIDGDMDDPDVRMTLVLEYAELSGVASAQPDIGLYGKDDG